MRFLLNEGLNVTTFRYCCLGFFLFWQGYLFSAIDAVTATFNVLVNAYLLNFRLALLNVQMALARVIYLATFNNSLVFNSRFLISNYNFLFPE